MDNSLQYFFPSSENVDLLNKIIKFQGMEVIPKAQAGRRSIKKTEDRFFLHGFVLCRIETNIAWVDLICSRENSKVGQLLIDLEENIKKNKDVKVIQLYSLPKQSLKKWYIKMGYSVSDVRIWDGKPKAYLMQKFI